MSGKKAPTSTAEASGGSAQSKIKENKHAEMTCSETTASALRSLTASTPEVRVPPESLSDTRTSLPIRALRSTPEGFKNVLHSKKETVLEKQTALTPRTELSEMSNDPGKLSPAGRSPPKTSRVGKSGSKKLTLGSSLPTSDFKTTSFSNIPASPSGTSQTLVSPNRPDTLTGVLPLPSLQTSESVLDHEESARPVMKPKGESPTFQYGMDAMPGHSRRSKVPILNLTESTPLTGPPTTHVLVKTDSFKEEALYTAAAVGTCAVPIVDIVVPGHRPLGSSATRIESQDPNRLLVPRRSRSRRRQGEDDDENADGGWVDPFEPYCDDKLGACLVRPCPSMLPYRRWFACACCSCFLLIVTAFISSVVFYDWWSSSF